MKDSLNSSDEDDPRPNSRATGHGQQGDWPRIATITDDPNTVKGKSARQVELGDRIRRNRERLGLSQEALAHEASINRTYIASLEAGQRNPSLDMLARLATGLGIDLGEFGERTAGEEGSLTVRFTA